MYTEMISSFPNAMSWKGKKILSTKSCEKKAKAYSIKLVAGSASLCLTQNLIVPSCN